MMDDTCVSLCSLGVIFACILHIDITICVDIFGSIHLLISIDQNFFVVVEIGSLYTLLRMQVLEPAEVQIPGLPRTSCATGEVALGSRSVSSSVNWANST